MEVIRDLLLGIVQGICEFLPVSSKGHMILIGHVFKTDLSYLNFYLSLLRVSSLFALILVIFKDFIKLIIGAFGLIVDMFSNIGIFISRFFSAKVGGYYILASNPARKIVIRVFVSGIFSALTGLFAMTFAKDIEEMPMAVGICFCITAVLLLLGERMHHSNRKLTDMSAMDAVIIGIIQGVAVIPGISRMAFVYIIALILGFSSQASFKYSCYLAIPSIVSLCLAGFVNMAGTSISLSMFGNIILGMILCGIFSFISFKVSYGLCKSKKYSIIAVYGLILGIVTCLLNINL